MCRNLIKCIIKVSDKYEGCIGECEFTWYVKEKNVLKK